MSRFLVSLVVFTILASLSDETEAKSYKTCVLWKRRNIYRQ